jgi:acetoin utilization protein AcuC
MQREGLDRHVLHRVPAMTGREQIERFHTTGYVDLVKRTSDRGAGLLDYGDTPAFPGCYEAAARVVGSALDLLDEIMAGRAERGFLPIGGLHHARRGRAGGFCVINDCGVVIETLRARYGWLRGDVDRRRTQSAQAPHQASKRKRSLLARSAA